MILLDVVLLNTLRLIPNGVLCMCRRLIQPKFAFWLFSEVRRHGVLRSSCVRCFSAPLCQAALLEGACESAIRLLKTASEMRLLRHRSASLRDLPSSIFLR